MFEKKYDHACVMCMYVQFNRSCTRKTIKKEKELYAELMVRFIYQNSRDISMHSTAMGKKQLPKNQFAQELI